MLFLLSVVAVVIARTPHARKGLLSNFLFVYLLNTYQGVFLHHKRANAVRSSAPYLWQHLAAALWVFYSS